MKFEILREIKATILDRLFIGISWSIPFKLRCCGYLNNVNFQNVPLIVKNCVQGLKCVHPTRFVGK